MPAIVEMRLRPSGTIEPTTRQLHGLACAVFEGADSDDHLGPNKQFATWPLKRASDGWLLHAAWLRSGLPHSVLAACGQLRLGPMTCAVTDLALRPASHAEIASGPPLREAKLTFHSPTYFSQNGVHVVLPDPRLIVGSWRRRWNASLPEDHSLMIGDDQWREIHHVLRLANFELRTQAQDAGHGHDQGGFTGTATLRLDKNAPAASCRNFGILARFAEFCGTGAQTTHGFGATTLFAAHEHQTSASRPAIRTYSAT
jgi:CRISPR-associated endoribonuclease Cas6